MGKKVTISRNKEFKMRHQMIKKANFVNLLKKDQIGPNGRGKEWLKIAHSEELMSVLENKGSSEYFKELKEKLASKGFYRELLK